MPSPERGSGAGEELCPACLHAEEDHIRESWFDEEGIEGMSCQEDGCTCQWWTWSWAEVLNDEVTHEGTDVRPQS